jgi:YesN/AraC family two-component response regulator
VGNYFVEKGTLTILEENTLFEVKGRKFIALAESATRWRGGFPADLKFYWLHFEVAKHRAATSPLAIEQHCSVRDAQYVISLFRQFLSEQEKLQQALRWMILLLILQQFRSLRDMKTMDEAGAAMAWKAKQLIRTQFHLPLSTSQLAKELHCNADYLGRVFRRTFHLTLTEAIHRQRVRAAEKLLLNDSASLTEVATRCGFNDVGYFRQIF